MSENENAQPGDERPKEIEANPVLNEENPAKPADITALEDNTRKKKSWDEG
jgi:hypothetical protein